MERSSTSHIIRESNISNEKSQQIYYNDHTPEHREQQILVRMWMNMNYHSLLVEMKMVQPLGKTVWRDF